jgi:hypothetical protein
VLDVFGRVELEGRPYVERGLHRVGGAPRTPACSCHHSESSAWRPGFSGPLDPLVRLEVVVVRVPIVDVQKPVIYMGIPPDPGDGGLVDVGGILVVAQGERRFEGLAEVAQKPVCQVSFGEAGDRGGMDAVPVEVSSEQRPVLRVDVLVREAEP